MITTGMLGKSFVAASMAATKRSMSGNGWIRLAKVESFSGEDRKYVVAIRATNSDKRPFQLGCSCPDWIHRRRGQPTISLCKHQAALLADISNHTNPMKGFWYYNAGRAAFDALRANMKK